MQCNIVRVQYLMHEALVVQITQPQCDASKDDSCEFEFLDVATLRLEKTKCI